MKRKYLIHAAICCAALSSFTSCDRELARYQDSVRDYLSEIHVTDYEEIEWGTVDSVFSPYVVEKAFQGSKRFVEHHITRHEINILSSKDRKHIRVLKDSIAMLRDSLSTLDDKCESILAERKNNRLGLPLRLTYTTPFGEVTKKFIFVFDRNTRSVSHHLDEFGNSVE